MNNQLRAVRMAMRLSQDEFAAAIRAAGDAAQQPNGANKRLVQRWEAGQTAVPQPVYARALEAVTGRPIEALGFGTAVPDGLGGHDVVAPVSPAPIGQPAPSGTYAGVWRSRYEYHSSARDGTYVGEHYVVLLQHGSQLTVRSLAGSALSIDLTVDGNVLTGTWTEVTDPDGYYRGARYHGAIQLLAEPTGRRLSGKWVGFGREMDINTGPWSLTFETASTSKATLEQYSRKP